jgi:uncharacterized phage protein gp47/JayE
MYLESEVSGISANNVAAGTPAVPVNNISGLASSTFGELIEPGTEAEGDERFRDRIIEKIAGPAENGNRQHYKTWSESVEGVGRAKIIPLFAGANTVMGVIIGADGLPAAQTVVERVQEYIDPITLGTTVEDNGDTVYVGDGLGDGVANIGAHYLAVAPDGFTIDVSFVAEFNQGTTIEQIRERATTAITEHLKDLALNTPERQAVIVRVSAITQILYSIQGLIDYSNLSLNGENSNVELNNRQVPIVGEVSVNAVI